MKQKKLCFILGTRPEVIKLGPLIMQAKQDPLIETLVINTGQHKDLSDKVFEAFDIKPTYDLKIMKQHQTLEQSTSNLLLSITPILNDENPQWVIVQGDTNSTFSGALAAFYKKISVAHVEAGLRSNIIYSPWPEEMNRRLVSKLAKLHFTPTLENSENLLKEGVERNCIYQTGNTGIDALKLLNQKIEKNDSIFLEIDNHLHKLGLPDDKKRFVLITTHRRESFEKGISNVCDAIIALAQKFSDTNFVFPVHPNPRVSKTVFSKLKNREQNILLLPALGYLEFILLMKRSDLVMTDSGGVQEEGPSLGKRIIVLREVTERLEGLKTGFVRLTGTSTDKIISVASEALTNVWSVPGEPSDVYGDGTASQKIIKILKKSNL